MQAAGEMLFKSTNGINMLRNCDMANILAVSYARIQSLNLMFVEKASESISARTVEAIAVVKF